MSDADLEWVRSISKRLLAIQADALGAHARNDTAASVALFGPVSACLADALAVGEPGVVGLAYQIKARVHLCAGDAPQALADALQGEAKLVGAVDLPGALAAHPRLDQVLESRSIRVQGLAALQDLPGVAALAQDTIQILETRRAHLHDPFQQAAFLADRTLFYEMFAFSSFKLERWDDLLTAMDLLKARASYLKRSAARTTAEDPEIAAKLAAANAALTNAAPGSPPYRAALEQRRLLISLRAITRVADDADATADAGADAIPRLELRALQAALAPDEAVIAWVWVAPEVLITVAFDAAQFHAERILLNSTVRADLDSYVDALRAQRLDPATLDATIEPLVAALLPPAILERLTQCQRLVFSPHRALHVVPFHAAQSGERWLIERCAVRYAATLGSLLLPRTGAAAAVGLFALGIDEFSVAGERWPDLNHAESEVADVAEVWKSRSLPVLTLTGPSATVAAWRALGSRLASFRCLHIATHGASVFDREAKNDPLAARLILEDGALDALALSQLRLGADVVVLSACNSGQRALEGRGLDEYPGDDNFGLQAAFFEAGAQAVVGALWPVLDEVAPFIMKKLQEGLADGQAADLALQAALIDYLGRTDARREVYAWGSLFLSAVVVSGRAESK